MPQLTTYPYQQQRLSEWCWCAAAASIAGWYRQRDVSQCEVAEIVFGVACVGDTPLDSLNEPKPLDLPLRRLKNLAAVLDGAVSFEQVTHMIDQGRPVGVRIQWVDAPGVGHMVALSGYDVSLRAVMVEDPKFGQQQCAYEGFRDSYLGHGFWSFTYVTRTNA